jgi:hypothetical protein
VDWVVPPPPPVLVVSVPRAALELLLVEASEQVLRPVRPVSAGDVVQTESRLRPAVKHRRSVVRQSAPAESVRALRLELSVSAGDAVQIESRQRPAGKHRRPVVR